MRGNLCAISSATALAYTLISYWAAGAMRRVWEQGAATTGDRPTGEASHSTLYLPFEQCWGDAAHPRYTRKSTMCIFGTAGLAERVVPDHVGAGRAEGRTSRSGELNDFTESLFGEVELACRRKHS